MENLIFLRKGDIKILKSLLEKSGLSVLRLGSAGMGDLLGRGAPGWNSGVKHAQAWAEQWLTSWEGGALGWNSGVKDAQALAL